MANSIELSIFSWNVRGLSDPSRKIILKNWLNTISKPIDISLLQELKADEYRLNISLSYILPTYNLIVAYPNEGCGGTAIFIHPRFKIVNSGAITRGLVWETIELGQDLIHITSVYAPNTYSGSVHPLTVCTGGLLTQSSCRLQGLVLGKMAQ
jgi:exonuclease III